MPGKIQKIIALCAALALFAGAAGVARAAGDDPTVIFREREARVRQILMDPKADTQSKKGMLAGQISEVFDFMELARRSLSDHWTRLSVAQRDQFAGTLKELIQISILEKLTPNRDYKVDVNKAQVHGKEAELPAMVATSTTMPGDEVELEFRLHKANQKGWVIYDMIIDEVSLLNNYRQQFNKILSEQPFDKLLEQMKEKLEYERNAQ